MWYRMGGEKVGARDEVEKEVRVSIAPKGVRALARRPGVLKIP